jgi:hypothetical protein
VYRTFPEQVDSMYATVQRESDVTLPHTAYPSSLASLVHIDTIFPYR